MVSVLPVSFVYMYIVHCAVENPLQSNYLVFLSSYLGGTHRPLPIPSYHCTFLTSLLFFLFSGATGTIQYLRIEPAYSR